MEIITRLFRQRIGLWPNRDVECSRGFLEIVNLWQRS
jgi:hypothetical protein